MTFYCAYVNEVVQWKAIPLLVTFLVSYLLNKSLKSHSVLGLIPSCHFRSPDSFLLPCRLPALICRQTFLTLSNVALRLTSFFFSDCSLFPFNSFSPRISIFNLTPLSLHSFVLFLDVGSVEGLAYHRGWDMLYWTSYTTSTITRHTVDQSRWGAVDRHTVVTMSGDDHPRAFVLDECQG